MTEKKSPLCITSGNCPAIWSTQGMLCGSAPGASRAGMRYESNCSCGATGQYPYLDMPEVLKMMRYADQPLPADAINLT